jgi:hypothetical protein
MDRLPLRWQVEFRWLLWWPVLVTFLELISTPRLPYCPAMPESLVNATKHFRDGKIDEVTHRARIAERQRLAIRMKSQPDADGHIRVLCPAAGPAPQVRCQLKPASEGGDGKVRIRIPVTDVLAAHPPKICTQGSITLPPRPVPSSASSLPMNPTSGTVHTPPSGTRTRG